MAQLIGTRLAWKGIDPVVRTYLRTAEGEAQSRDVPIDDRHCYFYAKVTGLDLGRYYHEANDIRETAKNRAAASKCVARCCKKNGRLQPCLRDLQRYQGQSFITRCEPVKMRSVVGFGAPQFMWRVHVRFPWNRYAVSWAIRTIVERNGGCVDFFELDVDCTTRWMVDSGIVGMGWLNHDLPIDRDDNAPLVTVALDIECMATRPGVFCAPDADPIIQIACVKTVYGQPGFHESVFVLDTCTDIDGVDVFSFAQERDLIAAFFAYLDEHKPDIVTGYNSNAFDLPYIFARRAFWRLGPYYSHKDKTALVSETVQTAASKQAGGRERHVWDWAGCVVLDVLEVVRGAYKLSSYKLNDVARRFLDQQEKDDLPYAEIPRLQRGSADDRARMARYCVQDTRLVAMLIAKL